MDKDKILEKYKKENSLGDERDKNIDLQSNQLGIIFAMITFLLIFIAAKIKGFGYSQATIMFISIVTGNTLYKYLKNRKSMSFVAKIPYILVLLGWTILSISYFVEAIK